MAQPQVEAQPTDEARALTGCDVVVVGGGLGGLSCALELARQGMKAVVLEAGPLPGGCLRTFSRRGYHFHLSPQYLGSLQPEGATHAILRSFGVLDRLSLDRPELFLSASFPDLEIQLPNDRDGLQQALVSRFPREREGIDSLFEQARNIGSAVADGALGTGAGAQAHRRMVATWRNQSFEQLLAGHVVDPRLRALLGQTWMNMGLPPGLAAASTAAAVFHTGWIQGIHTIAGGGTALVRALVDRLRELGGDCLPGRAVQRITVAGGRIAGVVLADGTEVGCPLVVAAVDPYRVFFDLMPGEEVSRLFRFRLERMEPSLSMISLHLGLDCPPSALGIPRTTTFVNTQPDHEEAYRRAAQGELHHSSWRLTSYEGAHDECSPPGAGIATLTEVAAARDWVEINTAVDQERRAAVQETLLAKADLRFPGLRDHVVLAELATPRTLARLFGNHRGAAFGFAQTAAQSGNRRLAVRGPVAGLFLAGAWAYAGGGCEAVLMGGVQTANAALEYAERPRLHAPPRLSSEPLPAAPAEVQPVVDGLPWPTDAPVAPDHFRHHHELLVYACDLNPRGFAHTEAYLRYLDRARMEAIEAICAEHQVPSWHDSHFVNIYRIQARYETVAALGRRLDVVSGLSRVTSHRGAFHQRIVDRDSGSLLLDGCVQVLFLDRAHAMVALPPEFPDCDCALPWVGEADRRELPFTDEDRFPFRSVERVYFEDTDLQGITFHVSYVRFAERALFDLVRTIWPGFGPREWMHRYRVAISGLDIRYLRATQLGDRLDVWTGMVGVRQRSLAFGHRLVLQDTGEAVADMVTWIEFRDDQERVIEIPRQAADLARANLLLASRLRQPRKG